MSSFIHLRVHTEYSLVDGLVKVKGLLNQAEANEMPAVAMSDENNLCGFIRFYSGALGKGIKPICGADIMLEATEQIEQRTRMTLLAMSNQGYKNIIEVISKGYQYGQVEGRPVIKREWVAEHSEDVIALSGGVFGDVGFLLSKGRMEEAQTYLKGWMDTFPGRFYAEVVRTLRPGEEDYIHQVVPLASEYGCPVVATNDVRFLKREDFEAHEARVSIYDGVTLDDPRRVRKYSEEQYFKTSAEMEELFSDLPEALENTIEIAKRCNVDVLLGTYFLPDFPVPDGMTMEEYFRELSHHGLQERFELLVKKGGERVLARKQEYIDRLNFELDIINQMGFPGYFLIVMDFIQWSKDNDIPVGPGRGSGAGSLVAYALKITDLDPLEYDLLFERFLNPERVSMPDFDIDFCMDNRDRVIDYVAQRYGRNAVSQIITFGQMAAKAVVRDVARVQGKSYSLGDKLSKLIPFEIGMTLKKALEDEPALVEFIEGDEEAAEVMEMAFKLEGTVRNFGKHAGGVVIAPTKLTDFAPLYCEEDGTGLVTQYDKNDVEEAGLVKFDFLGLKTLTVVDWALESINEIHAREGKPPLDIALIDLEDKATYDLLQRAETTAVFQLESRGMKELIKKLLPSRFEDIIALVALYRPGPLGSGMVDDFINRKHGRSELAFPHPDYQHEDLIPVLEPTYGIILYQEQVMQIAQVLAKFSLGGADLLRRAMGKKKAEVMQEQRLIFMEGAAKNNIDKDLAGNIFDLMEKFAGYGFNKSHSAAYALVSYQTAWLKQHYPAPFMAAVLSADMQNTDKIVIFVEECRAMNLVVDLPNVNESVYKFAVNREGAIVYGLGAIKGVGEGPIEAIVEARKEGPFEHIFDFCQRVGRRVNRRVMEALVRSGAFDTIGPNRATLFASIEEALKRADQSAKSHDAGMGDLFGIEVEESTENAYDEIGIQEEWHGRKRLDGEKDTLGLYVTGHPIDDYETEIRRFARQKIVDLQPKRETQVIAGLIVEMRITKSKRGGNIAFVTLDDRSARIEVAVFPDTFESVKQYLIKDSVVVIEGEISIDEFRGGQKVAARNVLDMAAARIRYVEALRIDWLEQEVTPNNVQKLADAIAPYRGDGCDVVIGFETQQAVGDVRLGPQWKIRPDDDLIHELQKQYGKQNVQLVYT
ncbi:DNA polymerase III subunit alpha [Marinomonas ostreistagni]|uniref:DNA polymerase III subunit alpha n=1 Tax=Marinomonas ostreistagni TaxID=359209 RepID=UPI0019516FAA|nr:DNA polymerase III subunit alpha [Marinomonas ostreistagni]MBM6551678.1 DNA polymerase III subunit alpha [Marinomonas ostreistagni]